MVFNEGKILRIFYLFCYTFFVILLLEFWDFCGITVSLLIIQNIGNAPLILKIVSQHNINLFE